MSGKWSQEIFNRKGELRNIHRLRHWALPDVLHEKYHFSAEESKKIPDAAFQQELTRRGLTAADMREGMRRDLLSQKVIEHQVGSKIAVSDRDVTDFFNANRAQFNVPEEAYHLAQIVVTPVRDDPGCLSMTWPPCGNRPIRPIPSCVRPARAGVRARSARRRWWRCSPRPTSRMRC